MLADCKALPTPWKNKSKKLKEHLNMRSISKVLFLAMYFLLEDNRLILLILRIAES